MNKTKRPTLKKFKKNENGAILLLTMVFMIIVTLMLVPLLTFSTTGIKTGNTFDDKADALYAADAGIEDAKWQIKYDQLSGKFGTYDHYDYSTTWTYSLPQVNGKPEINNKDVTLSLKNNWVPKNITAPDKTTATAIINNTKLMVTGGPYDASSYNIVITYSPGPSEVLKINTIGLWLPPGYTYITGSSNLGSEPATSGYQGGQSVVWTLAAVNFTSLPGVNSTDSPMTAKITFNYSPSTTLSSNASAGSSSVHVVSTTGFPNSGSISLKGESLPITYSGITVNTITGIPTTGSGALTIAHSTGERVGLGVKPDAVSWINTSNVSGLSYTWDDTVRVFHITSTAGTTTVDTYVAKSELRKLGGALNGDYYATGNSLMRDLNADGNKDTQVTSSAVVATPNPTGADNGVPDDANVSASFLYWGSWYRNTTGKCTTVLTDDGSKFYSGGGYFDNGSAWNAFTNGTDSYFWAHYSSGADTTKQLSEHTALDLSSYASSSYITTLSWDQWVSNFTTLYPLNPDTCSNFNNWNQPSNSSWSVSSGSFRGRYVSSTGINRDLPLLNGLDLSSYTPNTVTISWSQWESNIASGDGLNFELSADGGTTWSSPIKAFDYSDLAAGKISTSAKTFTYSFSTSTYLTNNFKIRFSLVGFSASNHYCYIDNIYVNVPAPTYSSADKLQFALSNDDGATWSNYITAFTGDKIGSSEYVSTVTYQYTIPITYLTSHFKAKLYIVGFNGPGQHCCVDNIRINALNPDTGLTFKIDNGSGAKIVYFDSNGNPATSSSAANQVVSTHTQALLTYSYSTTAAPAFNGFAYSCYRDVTALVKKYANQPVSPATNFNGHATYTAIGDIGDTAQALSHAGWSLVTVFTGPETQGHQLYLYDNFFGSKQDSSGVHVDWDGDGVAGGTLTGFVVPQKIPGEVNAAKVTCFVTEGDNQLTGDYFSMNGTKLWDGTNPDANNSKSNPNNVWNAQSYLSGGYSMYDGVDIDTLGIDPTASPPQYITWNSNILRPGDTSASIDLYTQQDYWFMIYMIISFRSETVTGGSLNYLIHG